MLDFASNVAQRFVKESGAFMSSSVQFGAMMTAVCLQCHCKILDDARFCHVCGFNRLQQAVPVTQQMCV
jgi:hypothetical protein